MPLSDTVRAKLLLHAAAVRGLTDEHALRVLVGKVHGSKPLRLREREVPAGLLPTPSVVLELFVDGQLERRAGAPFTSPDTRATAVLLLHRAVLDSVVHDLAACSCAAEDTDRCPALLLFHGAKDGALLPTAAPC